MTLAALWLYAVTGTLYLLLYAIDIDIAVRHVNGPLGPLLMFAPVLFSPLVARLWVSAILDRLYLRDTR